MFFLNDSAARLENFRQNPLNSSCKICFSASHNRCSANCLRSSFILASFSRVVLRCSSTLIASSGEKIHDARSSISSSFKDVFGFCFFALGLAARLPVDASAPVVLALFAFDFPFPRLDDRGILSSSLMLSEDVLISDEKHRNNLNFRRVHHSKSLASYPPLL